MHRNGPPTGVDECGLCIQFGRSFGQFEAELARQRDHLGVVAVDELGTALAGLAIGEAMAEHAATHAIAGLQHHHVGAGGHQFGSGAQARQACADDHGVVMSSHGLNDGRVAGPAHQRPRRPPSPDSLPVRQPAHRRSPVPAPHGPRTRYGRAIR